MCPSQFELRITDPPMSKIDFLACLRKTLPLHLCTGGGVAPLPRDGQGHPLNATEKFKRDNKPRITRDVIISVTAMEAKILTTNIII